MTPNILISYALFMFFFPRILLFLPSCSCFRTFSWVSTLTVPVTLAATSAGSTLQKKKKKNESVAPSVKHKPIFFLSFLFFSPFSDTLVNNLKTKNRIFWHLVKLELFFSSVRAAFGLTSSPVKLTSGMTHWHLIKKEKRKIKYGPLEHFRCVIACKVHIKLIKFPKEIRTAVIQRRVF